MCLPARVGVIIDAALGLGKNYGKDAATRPSEKMSEAIIAQGLASPGSGLVDTWFGLRSRLAGHQSRQGRRQQRSVAKGNHSVRIMLICKPTGSSWRRTATNYTGGPTGVVSYEEVRPIARVQRRATRQFAWRGWPVRLVPGIALDHLSLVSKSSSLTCLWTTPNCQRCSFDGDDSKPPIHRQFQNQYQ